MPLTCSARDCRADAEWALLWNNPRLHTPDRRKSWLACDVHRATLADFLGARGFLIETVTLDALEQGVADAPDRLSRKPTPGDPLG
jgi:hypothetical protein